MSGILTALADAGFIAVTEITDAARAIPLAAALLQGGVRAMEVAFRDPERLAESANAIAQIRRSCPDMLVGGATIRNAELAAQATDAGAQFLLSAGFNPSTVSYCANRKLLLIPGLCTPGEVEQALSAGIETVKFFPAHVFGGSAMLKALAGPYPNVRFVVSGGVNAENAPAYLALKNVAAISGSWVAPKAAIAGGDFDAIKTRASEVAALIDAARSQSCLPR